MKRIRQIEQNGGPLRKNRSTRSTKDESSSLYMKTPNPNSTELLPLSRKNCPNVGGEIQDTASAILRCNIKENVYIPNEDEDDTIENAAIKIQDKEFAGTFRGNDLSARHINQKLSDVETLDDRLSRFQMVCKTKVSRKVHICHCKCSNQVNEFIASVHPITKPGL